MSSNLPRLGYSLEFADNLSLSVGGFSDKLPELMKARRRIFALEIWVRFFLRRYHRFYRG